MFAPDGSTLATAAENTAKVWDARTGELVTTANGKTDWLPFIGGSSYVSELTYGPDGSMLAAASGDTVMVLKKKP
ncbi:WD40 repeat domain-containing protein [Actinomadura sp. CNU-125]|uniref:WD40 repeat domain-containing protein n=1 Tax=Actinomadura sp. CNU-125 TaxID=1904961 RepID=UPI0039679AC9